MTRWTSLWDRPRSGNQSPGLVRRRDEVIPERTCDIAMIKFHKTWKPKGKRCCDGGKQKRQQRGKTEISAFLPLTNVERSLWNSKHLANLET